MLRRGRSPDFHQVAYNERLQIDESDRLVWPDSAKFTVITKSQHVRRIYNIRYAVILFAPASCIESHLSDAYHHLLQVSA